MPTPLGKRCLEYCSVITSVMLNSVIVVQLVRYYQRSDTIGIMAGVGEQVMTAGMYLEV